MIFFKRLDWGSTDIFIGSGKHSHYKIVVNPEIKIEFKGINSFTATTDKKKIRNEWSKKKKELNTNLRISQQQYTYSKNLPVPHTFA